MSLEQLTEVIGARLQMHGAVDAGIGNVAFDGLHFLAGPAAQHQGVVAGIAVDAVLRVAIGHLDGIVLHGPILRCAEAGALLRGREAAGLNELVDGDVGLPSVAGHVGLIAAAGEQGVVGLVQLCNDDLLVGFAIA